MRPLGKVLKTGTMDHVTEQEALKEFLVSSSQLPCHPTYCKRCSPGHFLLRDGYRADYPFRKPIDNEQVANVRDCDQAYKEAIQDKANKPVTRHTRTTFKSETRYCQRTIVPRSLSLNFIQHHFRSLRLGIMAYFSKIPQMERHFNVTRMM